MQRRKQNHYENKDEMGRWYAFADALDRETFPALRTLHVPWFFLWPATPYVLPLRCARPPC